MQGNLKDMPVADLIQHLCQERKTAELSLEQDQQKAQMYFKDGALVHAAMGKENGEDVVFHTLMWDHGKFNMETGIEPPYVSIHSSWSNLLLEGARRLDENTAAVQETKKAETNSVKEDKQVATKKKSELLADTLEEVISNSTDINGLAVVGIDGLVYSVNSPVGNLDETLIGAVAAAALGLSKRSTEQLQRGAFQQTLIQGDKGNIVVTQINPETLLIAITNHGVNLGMVFAETKRCVTTLHEIL